LNETDGALVSATGVTGVVPPPLLLPPPPQADNSNTEAIDSVEREVLLK